MNFQEIIYTVTDSTTLSSDNYGILQSNEISLCRWKINRMVYILIRILGEMLLSCRQSYKSHGFVLLMEINSIFWWKPDNLPLTEAWLTQIGFGIFSHHCTVQWIQNLKITLKVLGKSVGLCKTAKRKDQLYIRLLVSVLRIICENFNSNGLLFSLVMNENINKEK